MTYKRWCESGVWYEIVEHLRKKHIAQISILFLDSTSVRAHQHSAGVRKSEGDQALGRSKGGHTTKIHMIAGGTG
jgi:transposase